MSTTAIRPEIADLAAAVRGDLDDLPVDDVDELTDGNVISSCLEAMSY